MSVAVAEALHRANQQLAQGQGPVVDFLGKGWQDTTVGDSEGLYVVDVVMPEEVAEGDSDVLLLEYELPLRVPRPKGSARPSRSASGSPYLTGMGSSVRQRSSSGEAVKPSSSSSSWMGEPPAEGGAARGRSDPNTERGKVQDSPTRKISLAAARRRSGSERGGAAVSMGQAGMPAAKPKPPKKYSEQAGAAQQGEHGADGSHEAEFIKEDDALWENPTEGGYGRQDRAWNDKGASDWFKGKEKRRAVSQMRAKQKEHEQILKDLSFIQERKSAQNDRAHAMKLTDPRYAYHVRRWIAAATIQRHARAHYATWTKTGAWRARVNLHPEMRRQMFLDYMYKSRWDAHEVPRHLLDVWNAAESD